MSPTRRNLVVGVVVLGALGVLAWMILQFAGTAADFFFARGSKVTILADSASGVAEGSSVDYLGVNVGHVLSVRLSDDNRRVVIESQIDEGKQVPKNVRGVIRATSALGGTAAISLETVGQPAGEFLTAGDTIKASGRAGGLIPPEFTNLANDVRERELIRHLDEMVVSIRLQSEKLGKLTESVNELVSDDEMRGDLRETLASINATSKQAKLIADDFKKFSGGLDTMSDQLNDRLEQVGKTLEGFQVIAARTERGEGTLGMLTKDPRLYDSLVDTSRELNLTIRDLKRLVEQWEQEGVTFKLR